MAYPAVGYIEAEYLNLLNKVIEDGEQRKDRTGVGTRALFGERIKGSIAVDFPLLTTKKVFWKGVVEELFWMISGLTNAKVLSDKGVHIWDAWADPNTGELGPVYGAQWKAWPSASGPIDQLANVISSIKTDPTSRRLIVNSWNVALLPEMKLPPCHFAYQFFAGTYHHPACTENMERHKYVCTCALQCGPLKSQYPNNYLDCMVTMRSCDIFLGLPFNIASYSLLTHLVGHVTNRTPRNLIMSLGDVHLYDNHLDVARTQLTRTGFNPPTLDLSAAPTTSIDDIKPEHVKLNNYVAHEALKAKIAV